jgi:hypothetical protein
MRDKYFADVLLFLIFIVAILPVNSLAQGEPEEDAGPLLLSVSPLTAHKGVPLKLEVRGNRLDSAYAVWIDDNAFKGRILSVEEVKDQVKIRINPLEKPKKSEPVHRAMIELQIEETTRTGVYALRLVSPRGISNPIGFPVVDAPVNLESAGSHQTIEQSQRVTLPGFISGKIGEPGEVDTYSFHVRKGQRLRFQAVAGHKFNPSASAKFALELALYRGGCSWFDPRRPTRVLFDEERSSDLMHVDAEGAQTFSEDGEYFLQVSGVFGQGCPDCTYQVRVYSGDESPGSPARNELSQLEWIERSVSRKLTDNWIPNLQARSIAHPETTTVKDATSSETTSVRPGERRPSKQDDTLRHPVIIAEHETNQQTSQTEAISVPAIVEGTIERPGDVDSFKFKVDAGQKLAFEIETSATKRPYFNPRVGVVDNQDRELFSNVERRLSMFNNNADPQVYLRSVHPKAIYSFDRAGDYLLQVRDITSRYGGSSYRYRILARPQIPHVGEISVLARDTPDGSPQEAKNEVNRINLVRTEPKKLILRASYEEGFSGDVSFFFTELPEGVQVFPAVQFNDGRAPLEVTQNPDIVVPKEQKAAIVLLASPTAPLTTEPRIVQLRCQLIANGKLGPNLLVRQIPLMIVDGAASKADAKPQSGK